MKKLSPAAYKMIKWFMWLRTICAGFACMFTLVYFSNYLDVHLKTAYPAVALLLYFIFLLLIPACNILTLIYLRRRKDLFTEKDGEDDAQIDKTPEISEAPLQSENRAD
jgi:TRAP-type C4-dicarboxylate transport system permease small subunit